MNTSLVWYRQDLRTHDHAPLRTAAGLDGKANSDVPHQTFAVYCFDPREHGVTQFGFSRTGPHRTRFLLESVDNLRQALRRLGGELLIRWGHPEEVLPELIRATGAGHLHYHDAVGVDEESIADAVDSACREIDCVAHRHPGQTLLDSQHLPFPPEQTPELFTDFRRKVEKHFSVPDPLAEPNGLNGQLPEGLPPGELPTWDQLGLQPPAEDERALTPFRGGRSAGLARVHEYIWQQDCLRQYKQTRNGMLRTNDSSKFSPWLAAGCLSARTILKEIRRYERERIKNDSTYWLIFELLWRDYFFFILRKHQSKLFRRSGLRGLDLPWNTDRNSFHQWQIGETGYPVVDANMQELLATGYLSNRGRQIVASFLTKNLGIDWRMGAEWFQSQLIDHDVASNWGNWNYSAGVGNDARGFRFFHPIKQAERYDPQGEYVRHWLPVLQKVSDDAVHQPWIRGPQQQKQEGCLLGRDYPEPMVDWEKSVQANEKAYQQATRSAKKKRR